MTRLPSTVKVPFHLLRQYVCEATEVSTQASMRLVLTSHSINILVTATKLGQGNIFRSVCQEFCSQREGPASVNAGIADPPGADTPLGQTPHLGSRPTLRIACREIRPTSGRYASYWNAILFFYNSRPISRI